MINKRIDLQFVTNTLRTDLNIILGTKDEFGRAVHLSPVGEVIDDTTKILILDKNNRKFAVLICSLEKYSNLPEKSLVNSKKIKRALGPKQGNVLLDPLMYGSKGGVNYVFWPYCNPISPNPVLKRVQLLVLKPALFRWLRSTTHFTLTEPTPDELKINYLIPLINLSKNKKIGALIREEVHHTINKLNTSIWKPFFVMAHNDLWINNILIRDNKWNDFVIIDWAGAELKSYAIYDLVRVSKSLRLSERKFHNELIAHCNILRCELEDAKSYLLSSLAYLGMNLGRFPENNFLQLTKQCCNYLFSSLDK